MGIDESLPKGKLWGMETLRSYLKSIPPTDQEAFAERCGTSIGYLRKALSLGQQIGPDIVVAMERESAGAVRCEDIRPDVDWNYLRSSRKKRPHVAA